MIRLTDCIVNVSSTQAARVVLEMSVYHCSLFRPSHRCSRRNRLSWGTAVHRRAGPHKLDKKRSSTSAHRIRGLVAMAKTHEVLDSLVLRIRVGTDIVRRMDCILRTNEAANTSNFQSFRSSRDLYLSATEGWEEAVEARGALVVTCTSSTTIRRLGPHSTPCSFGRPFGGAKPCNHSIHST